MMLRKVCYLVLLVLTVVGNWHPIGLITPERGWSALPARMLKIYDFWHERLLRMVLQGAPEWFDDTRTPEVETRDDLLRRALRRKVHRLSTLCRRSI